MMEWTPRRNNQFDRREATCVVTARRMPVSHPTMIGLWDGRTNELGKPVLVLVPELNAEKVGFDKWRLPLKIAREKGFAIEAAHNP